METKFNPNRHKSRIKSGNPSRCRTLNMNSKYYTIKQKFFYWSENTPYWNTTTFLKNLCFECPIFMLQNSLIFFVELCRGEEIGLEQFSPNHFLLNIFLAVLNIRMCYNNVLRYVKFKKNVTFVKISQNFIFRVSHYIWKLWKFCHIPPSCMRGVWYTCKRKEKYGNLYFN